MALRCAPARGRARHVVQAQKPHARARIPAPPFPPRPTRPRRGPSRHHQPHGALARCSRLLALVLLGASLEGALCAHASTRRAQAEPPGLFPARNVLRLRGGSDLLQPTVRSARGTSPPAYSAEQLGKLHVLWFRAKRATLKGALAGLYCLYRTSRTAAPAGALADSPLLWAGARLFLAALIALVARPLDWKAVVALLMLGEGAVTAGGTSGSAWDMTGWGGGLVTDFRDKVL